MHIKNIIPIFFIALSLFACVSEEAPTWKAQGPEFSENKGNVEVFYDQDKIERPFGYIGVIEFTGKSTKVCQKLAAQHGANGIVIEGQKAFAFKYTDKLTKEEEILIREYLAPRYYRD